MSELAQALARAERAEKLAHELRQLLQAVPHGLGDHTDFCRLQHGGVPPRDDSVCHCHVGKIRRALQSSRLS
ncbi:MAG: hypothetical protein HQM04_11865 [Magnetococcales bacterium]|nr:hypothetical protein [Magnetococcales bacterium]MBF0115721.1 hypothetical protein [Magnetococcales bacterium]